MSDAAFHAFQPECPIPLSDYPTVQLAHGGGGRLSAQLIQKMFLHAFDNEWLRSQGDGACLEIEGGRLAFTTDSYVVRPLFFPGGDIGKLAVFGTVNDLAMCGAAPRYLSVGFILEEGLPMETLWRVTRSMACAARECGVRIVTGDTKVVDRGKGDGVYLNTAGIGERLLDPPPMPSRVRPGDGILLSGDLGRHGLAVMAVREGLAFETELQSDCAPLAPPVLDLIQSRVPVYALRDLTRGGLASALNEIAIAAGVSMCVQEAAIPVLDEVRGACELLGLDPLYVANEGRFITFVPEARIETALAVLKRHPVSAGACLIGSVQGSGRAEVVLRTSMGDRPLDFLTGEQLPRIC